MPTFRTQHSLPSSPRRRGSRLASTGMDRRPDVRTRHVGHHRRTRAFSVLCGTTNLDPRLRGDDGIFFQRQWVGPDCVSDDGARYAEASLAGDATRFPLGEKAIATFQSTHPQGCDAPQCGLLDRDPVSIHAPARVRHGPARQGLWHGGFNPRTRKGATHPVRRHPRRLLFQSTHPQGCDPPPLNSLNRMPEKGDPRESPLEAMHWYEHA